MSLVVPMTKTAVKNSLAIQDKRRIESREASKAAAGKQEGKYLKRARTKLNDRRNFHAKFSQSPVGGHAHKAPGSMTK